MAWPHSVPESLETSIDVPIRSSHALTVRSLCPFCGSNQDPDGGPCCAEWAATSGTAFETVAPVPDGPPRFVRGLMAVAMRLNEASQLLVMLIASSSVAMLVSLGMQSRLIAEHTQIDAAPIRAAMMPIPRAQIPALAKPVLRPPERSEPARAAADVPPAAAAPAVPPPIVVASLSPVLPRTAIPAPPAPHEIVGPALPTSMRLRNGWSSDVSKWQRLRRGMSRTAVRMIFGYPQWVDRHTTPHTEYWLFGSDRLTDGPWIAFFDNDGPVADWRRP